MVIMHLFSINTLYSYCFEPYPPANPPDAPYCGSYLGSGCSDFDIEMYKSAVETYIKRLKDYQYDVGQYASCMQTKVTDDWNDFVSQL